MNTKNNATQQNIQKGGLIQQRKIYTVGKPKEKNQSKVENQICREQFLQFLASVFMKYGADVLKEQNTEENNV